MKLNYHDRSDKACSMMKTRQDSGVTNPRGAVYAKIETEWS